MKAAGETPSGFADKALYYLAAILVGVATGLIGTALHLAVDRALTWPAVLRAHVGLDGPHFLLLTAAVSAALVLAAVWLVRTFVPEAGGSGVQEVEGAMEGRRTIRWSRVLPVKFVGGLLSLGSGLVLGREGPTIHMGASVAQAAAQGFKLPTMESRGLLAAGAAAGLAAAFSAPLASVLFVIEETRRQFPYSLKTYTGVMIASVVSVVVLELLAGSRPFMAMTVPDLQLSFLPAFVLLGLLLGVAGVVFNRCLIWALDMALALGRRTSFYLLPAVVGCAIGVLLVVQPEATQGGDMLALTLVRENLPLATIAIVVLVRFVMTLASYATGVPGGIFAPILALATALGLLFALCLELVAPLPAGAPSALAVAAMGGLFSSTIRAPLVGVVLIAELTGAYTMLLPTLVTCMLANLVADALGGRPIYEVLLERTLRLAGETPSSARPAANVALPIGGWDQR
ncbi:H(+)/Cl(-) exchange transporter ClcA [Chelatococcus reniformis]|uniref:ClC family H(+)/Cl(-) exchange transporter n=1 Tax=Chelatococcus reniformis TaxID=1494448 RepID=A0A916XMB8_9HYPH|nr:H(+)/Cl(-) exchange transporter ClcA [Chelatococcus reniformis]GGC82201.1 ClC family H(+)/Cl(-) exchange transporter [Chelatococcus reniformis]